MYLSTLIILEVYSNELESVTTVMFSKPKLYLAIELDTQASFK